MFREILLSNNNTQIDNLVKLVKELYTLMAKEMKAGEIPGESLAPTLSYEERRALYGLPQKSAEEVAKPPLTTTEMLQQMITWQKQKAEKYGPLAPVPTDMSRAREHGWHSTHVF